MQLRCMLITDPKMHVAKLIANQCERLAKQRLVANHSREALELAQTHLPEVAVLSLELEKKVEDHVAQIIDAVPEIFVIGTYRELSMPGMQKLGTFGVADLLSQPVDALQIFRAASKRFQLPFRRHDRYAVSLDVFRADGVLIGRSVDLSEGGMCLAAMHPMNPSESILIDVALNDAARPLRVRCLVVHVEGQAPAQVRAHLQFTKLWEPEHQRLVTYLAKLPQDQKMTATYEPRA